MYHKSKKIMHSIMTHCRTIHIQIYYIGSTRKQNKDKICNLFVSANCAYSSNFCHMVVQLLLGYGSETTE